MDFGVYVHIPFCARRCDYCAFATWTDRNHLQRAYVGALRREIAAAIGSGMPPASTVFFGGGTPSLLPAPALLDVVRAIPRATGAEVTVECNPDTVTPALMHAYAAGGVTRVSFGVQSTVPHVLALLGRAHDRASVTASVAAARDAGLRWSVDLVFGVAGESLADWRRTLDDVAALQPDHVSAYALTVEAGTPLALTPARHPDDDDQADKYALADDAFGEIGLEAYEISNWARPGQECRHNLLYWRQGDYRGFGCAAHSHQEGRRWWNVRTPERYIAAVDAGRSPMAGEEVLEEPARVREAAQLALRTADGVDADAFTPDARERLGPLLAPTSAGRLALTARGRLLANEVAAHLR